MLLKFLKAILKLQVVSFYQIQQKKKPQEGTVVAVSDGKYVEGKKVALDVKVGDKVIFSKYAGTDVKFDGTDYLIVRDSDILAVVE